ncbi:hypothetical protein ABT369_09090 [Dactylosporangium sp. NPDC000244]|uniref:hypothetical protein n=1 Tax=Dactylosporangium sp. NPDC000244 TaxID=3154365 RepID=UPI003330F0E1
MALVDPWPAALHSPAWSPPADRLAIRAGTAVRTLLTDPTYRTGAQRVGDQIRRAPKAANVWSTLRDRLSSRPPVRRADLVSRYDQEAPATTPEPPARAFS